MFQVRYKKNLSYFLSLIAILYVTGWVFIVWLGAVVSGVIEKHYLCEPLQWGGSLIILSLLLYFFSNELFKLLFFEIVIDDGTFHLNKKKYDIKDIELKRNDYSGMNLLCIYYKNKKLKSFTYSFSGIDNMFTSSRESIMIQLLDYKVKSKNKKKHNKAVKAFASSLGPPEVGGNFELTGTKKTKS